MPTKKFRFSDDYSEGCHPDILTALASTNLDQQIAYGDDEFSTKAKTLIQAQLGDTDAAIHFVSGGTLANLIIAASCLRSHEAVIAASSGHIVSREAGAVEATGHKILTMPSINGKLTADDVRGALAANAHFPHMVRPRLVYISNATELGTCYSRAELVALSEACRANDLLLMLDGARLGAALSAEGNDVSLPDLAQLTDIFWIGGTKAGALIGEAIVVNHPALQADFAFQIKQRGAMLAKGRVLGVQFQTLFENGLFLRLGRHANLMAQTLSAAIEAAGHTLSARTQTNQVFALLPNALITKLGEQFDFYVWEQRENDHAVVRLVTSWATPESAVTQFIDCVRRY